MPQVSRTEIFDLPRQDFYDVVVDYEAYPEFVDHMAHARVIETDGKRSRVQFKVHYIRDIPYTLDIYHDEPKRVWWELVESPLFKLSSGSWELKYKGKAKTEVTYTVEIVPRVLVPSKILDTLTRHNLPTMMHAFAARAGAVE